VIVLVAGTGTEVGKTWVTAAAASRVRARGLEVHARKPVQSFAPEDDGTDAHVLAAATGETPEEVCPPHRWFPVAMAPPIAARVLDRSPFTVADLVAKLPAAESGVLFVESAGGVRSPLAEDGDTVTLANSLHPVLIVLVADAGLGTINAVRLSADALALHNLVVVLNRFDPSDKVHLHNREWLVAREGLEVVTDFEALADVLFEAATR
jgi:dethiobiotin synthetase